MIQAPTPHFSRKVLLLSFIFLLANLGIYGLRQLSLPADLNPIAPRLISGASSQIEVRPGYDEVYRPAREDEELYSGAAIRTGEKEFAELVLGSNVIRLDELTELRIVKNNTVSAAAYGPDQPRLVLELVSGSLWIKAFDAIEVRKGQSISQFHHSVGIISYTQPLNRQMVITGDMNLQFFSKSDQFLSQFIVPLGNQVTFLDTQITDVYKALKPSKLKKELKMMPIAQEVLADDWVQRNTEIDDRLEALAGSQVIESALAYRIRRGYQSFLSVLTFTPEAKRNLGYEKARTMLNYLMGRISRDQDLPAAKQIIAEFETLTTQWAGDPQIRNLIVETLFQIEAASLGSPAYLLKESLIDMVAEAEGPYVFRIYLTDLRRSLLEEELEDAENIADKWLARWTSSQAQSDTEEFDRQSQLLGHTIRSFIDVVPLAILDIFDETGIRKMAYSEDVEEARFEVTSDRLQLAASLVQSYRYILAKQYLKSSYLSLDIEGLSPSLASTKIFLETGKLLAQRIEYAEQVLHGAAQPIDEENFFDYFQTIRRDEALSADLRKFFDLDQEEVSSGALVQAPTAAQVAEKFLDSRINVNFADISLQPEGGFYYEIRNARLLDRGEDNQTLSFDATYHFASNSVLDVETDGRSYKGPFTLSDLVILLKSGGKLESQITAPKHEGGVELLITDREKIEAQEGQAIAQDVARQLAYNQLTASGIQIPAVKFNLEITDELNLNSFRVTGALIERGDGKESIMINFDYHSGIQRASNVSTTGAVLLLSEVDVLKLKQEVMAKVLEIEKEIKTINDFNIFVSQNEMFIDSANIIYTSDGLLSLTSLEYLPLKLRVDGLYDPEKKQFVSVTHPDLSAENIAVKDYFEQLEELINSKEEEAEPEEANTVAE